VHSADIEDMRVDSIDLLIGPYRSGKTRLLLKRAIEQCLKNPEQGATIVVPSARYRTLLESRLMEIADEVGDGQTIKGFLGLRILTFYQYCEYVLRLLGNFNRLVPDELRTLLIASVLSKMQSKGNLHSIGPIVKFPGTQSAVLNLLDEFQRSAMSPTQILNCLKQSRFVDARHFELANVYKNYWDCLESIGRIDRRLLAYKLIEALAKQKEFRRGLDFIAFDGFDRLNPLQLTVIGALSDHTKELLISFDYLEPSRDSESEYLWKQSTYAQLQSILASKLRVIEVVAPTAHSSEPIKEATVEKFSAPDRYFEMAEIASRIKRAVAGRPEKLSNFLVVARSLDKYKSAAQAAFHDAGLDYFIDEPVKLAALPVVQFLIKAVSLHLNKFVREEFIFCLRSKYFKRNSFGLSEAKIDELDQLSRAKMVVGGEEQWLEAVSREDQLAPQLKRLFALLKPINAACTPEEYVVWIEDLIERIFVLASHDEFSDPFEKWEQESALVQVRRVLAMLIEEQTLLEKLKSKTEFSVEYLFGRLETLIEGSNFQRRPTEKSYVLVCGAELAPNQRFDEIYVAGLVEGEFPKRIQQNGFTSSEEVNNWGKFAVDIRNPRLDPAFETALFKSLIERATKRVVLSFPINEMSGQEMTPSSLLDELGLGEAERVPLIQPLAELLAEPNSIRNALASSLWQGGCEELPKWLEENVQTRDFVDELGASLAVARHRQVVVDNSPYNGWLADHVGSGTISVSLPKYWSASRLSDYGKCPFRYWVSHVLKIEPSLEPEEGVSKKLLGETYHKALELFYKAVIAAGLSIRHSNEQVLNELLEQACATAIAWLEEHPQFRQDEFWQYRCQEIKFRLRRFVLEERARAFKDTEDFNPLLTEASFGFEEEDSAPPLKIKTATREIAIRGRVDRVDIAAGSEASNNPRLRVVDYKTGSAAISKNDAKSGRNLQLPLYVLAVENAIVPKGKVVKAEYLSVAAAKLIGKLEFEEKTPSRGGEPIDWLAQTVYNVSTFVDRIDKGDFAVRPNGLKVCQSCDHKTICRIGELPRAVPEGHEGDRETD
jgi:ATP-dependent helicase/nuclease subunit B